MAGVTLRNVFPVLPMVMVGSLVEPVLTLPKAIEETLTVIVGLTAAVPLPLRETVTVGFAESLLAMARFPVTALAETGLNATARMVELPGATVAPINGAARLKLASPVTPA